MTATLVAGQELIETVIASAVAGIGVTFAYSVAIWGAARFAEHSRSDQPLAAAAAAVVAALGMAAVVAAIIAGILVMTEG